MDLGRRGPELDTDRNTFDTPETVAPEAFDGIRIDEGAPTLTIPARSVIVMELE